MQKLDAVERARAVMTEAMEWPDWMWLFEKAKVREAADLAAETFESANREARNSWSDDFKRAYAEGADAHLIKEADDQAARVTKEAETMFAEAEKRFNAALAREAARKALESFDLRETALAIAQSAGKD